MAPKLKGAAVGAVSALALAAAGQASAMDFQAGDTTVSLYGYTIGKVSYDIDENLGDATAASFNGLTDDNEADGYTDFDASQSRMGVRTTTSLGGSDLVTRVEGDFRGAGGGQFRLRHAYGEWNGILAGQTWSNYNSFVGSTPTIDFNSVAGNAGTQGRVAQVRYTVGDFSVSLEDPATKIAGATAKSSLPAVTARYQSSAGAVGYSVAGFARQIEDSAENDSAMGYGAFVAGSFDMGVVSIQGALNYTDGGGQYLYNSGIGFMGTDAYVDGDDIETVSSWGGTLGVSFDAGPGSVNIAYGRTKQDDTDMTGDDEVHQNAFVNYFWSPVDRVTYGIEYAWLKKEDAAGNKPDGSRVAFAAQYVF